MKSRKPFLGLLLRKECLVPARRGWLLLLIAGVGLFTAAIRGAYGFLAVNDPVCGGFLVLEGWSPDHTTAGAIAAYRRNHYDGLIVTGGPIERGGPLIEYKTYAELAAATLQRMGMNPIEVHTVPSPAVKRDRTYASALAVRKWLRETNIGVKELNIVGNGAHSRRTRLIYEKAFNGEVRVGITTGEEREFDSSRWWTSSQGFRVVVGEMIAYAYARLVFTPSKE